MTETQSFFLDLLKDYLLLRPTEERFDIDWTELFSCARKHQLSGIVFRQCRDFLPPEYGEAALESLTGVSFFYANRVAVMERIREAFDREGIGYIGVKGLSVARFYPDPPLRTMGDLDLVIRPADREHADALLLSLGFEGRPPVPGYEWKYTYHRMEFEVHDALVYGSDSVSPACQAYFDRCWEQERGHELDGSYHFLYVLFHLKKHFLGAGVGFRQFYDLAMLMKNDSSLSWERIEADLRELGMLAFARVCFALIRRWFGAECPLTGELPDEEFFEDATQYIFSNGVFGFQNRENLRFRSVDSYRGKGSSPLLKLLILLKSLFPSYHTMRHVPYYSFLEGRPWLLPAAWVYRFLLAVKNRKTRGVLRSVERTSELCAEELPAREKMLRQWGL